MAKIGLLLIICGVVIWVVSNLYDLTKEANVAVPESAPHRLISSPEDDNSEEEVVWIIEMDNWAKEHDWANLTPNGASLSPLNSAGHIRVRFSVYGDHYRLFGYNHEQLEEVQQLLQSNQYVINFEYTNNKGWSGGFVVAKGVS